MKKTLLTLLTTATVMISAHAVTNPETVALYDKVTLQGKIVTGFQYGKFKISKAEFEDYWGKPQFLSLENPINVNGYDSKNDPKYPKNYKQFKIAGQSNVKNIYLIPSELVQNKKGCVVVHGEITPNIKLKRDQAVNLVVDSVELCK